MSHFDFIFFLFVELIPFNLLCFEFGSHIFDICFKLILSLLIFLFDYEQSLSQAGVLFFNKL